MSPSRLFVSFACCLLAACGGGTSATPGDADTTPAAVAVQSGAGQEAEPGHAVPAAPTVIVRNAGGDPVAGARVAFAVDSGGGSIATASVVTNAAGVASPGSWTMGPVEGAQVLLATVASLPSVRIRAFSRVAPLTVVTATVPTTGATLTVSRAGLPLDGAVVRLPSGAMPSTAPVTLAVVSTAGVVLREGITPMGPALKISTTTTHLNAPAVVRLPLTAAAAGKSVMIYAYTPATGAFTILPPMGRTATTISAMLPTLGPATLSSGGSSASFSASGSRAEGDNYIGLSSIDPAVLSRDYDSGFRIQQNNWDFDNLAIAWLPFLSAGEGDPATENLDASSGMAATSLWYFIFHRNDQPLYKRFRLQADEPKSNRMGIRWAALSNHEVTPYLQQVYRNEKEYDDESVAAKQISMFNAIKAMFYANFPTQPVPLLYDVDDPAGSQSYAVSTAIATRTFPDGSIEIVIPDNNETAYRLSVNASGLVPVAVSNHRESLYSVRSVLPMTVRSVLDFPDIGGRFPQVLGGTVGDAEGWPTPELHWEKAKLDTKAPVFLADQLVQWWECATCPSFGITIPGVPAAASHPVPFQMTRIIGGITTPYDESLARSTIRWKDDSVTSDKEPSITAHLIDVPQPADGNGLSVGWLDWQTVSYRKVTLHSSPAVLKIGQDTTVTFTLAPSQPLPAGTTYSWVLVTSTGRDSVATTVPVHLRNLPAREGTLLIQAHETGSKRIIAKEEIPITVDAGLPYWRITTMADQDKSFGNGNPVEGDIPEMMLRVLTVPGAGLIAVNTTPGGSDLVLRVKPGGTWAPGTCCPPGPLGGDGQIFLGRLPRTDYALGPFFAGWGFTSWSQSTANLSSGTMTGQYVGGTMTYLDSSGAQQIGPTYGVRLTATRSGNILTGTITITGWGVDDETGRLDSRSEDPSRFPFTAVRMETAAAQGRRP